MTFRFRTFALVTVLGGASLAISGCGGGGGSSGGGGFQPPPPITVTRSYPAGRATPTNGGTAWNIVGVTTILTGQFGSPSTGLYDTLTIKTTFTQDVSNALPPPGQTLNLPAELGVGVAFNTGGASSGFKGCPSTEVQGFVIDGSVRNPDGSYNVFGTNGQVTGVEVPTSASGHTVTQTLPLGAIGVFDGQNVPTFGVVVQAVNGAPGPLGITDCVPPDGSQIPVNGP